METSWEEERREVFESVLACLKRHPVAAEWAACRTLLANLSRTRLVAGHLDAL